MANEKNLKPLGSGKLTPEQEHEIRSKGGEASQKVLKRKRSMKNAAQLLLGLKISGKQSQMRAILQAFGVPEDEMNYQMAILVAQLLKAGNGNTAAATFLRDTAGEGPSDRFQKQDYKLRSDEFKYQKKKDSGFADEAEADDDGFLEALGNASEEDWQEDGEGNV